MRRLVHGTPITPRRLLDTLAGGSFCVSFANPEQVEDCARLVGSDGVLILDNGAWSLRGSGESFPRAEFWSWANHWQRKCPQAVAVIPDVIDGCERANLEEISRAVRYGLAEFPERVMSIWHTADTQDYLATQLRLLNFVGIGSSGPYDVQRERAAYLERLEHVRRTASAILELHGRRPWIHLMRGLGTFHRLPWAESADSCGLAINHHRLKDQHGDGRARAYHLERDQRIQSAAATIPTRPYAGSNFAPAAQPPAYQLAQPDLFGES